MIEKSIIFIAILSAILFGSVESWAVALIGIFISGAFVLSVVRMKRPVSFSEEKWMFIFLTSFSLYSFFQIIPLPISLLSLLHPGIKAVVAVSPAADMVYHSISVYPFATERELARLVLYIMVFLIAAFGLDDSYRLRRILKALAIFGFALSLFGIIQKSTWNGKIYWFRELSYGGAPFGPFVNKNHFAGFVAMILPLSLGMSLMSKDAEKRVLYAFFSLVMAIAVFITLSRAGILSLLIGGVVFSSVVFVNAASRRKLIPVLIFLFIMTAALLLSGIPPVVDRFAKPEAAGDWRLIAWPWVLSAFADYPVFGSGFGTFQHVFKIYQPDGLYAYWSHALNDYLELLLEMGIAGFAIATAFVVIVIKRVVKSRWHDKDIYLKAGLLSSISTMLVHGFFNFNFRIPSNAILFFLVMGIAFAMSRLSNMSAEIQ